MFLLGKKPFSVIEFHSAFHLFYFYIFLLRLWNLTITGCNDRVGLLFKDCCSNWAASIHPPLHSYPCKLNI